MFFFKAVRRLQELLVKNEDGDEDGENRERNSCKATAGQLP